MKINEENLELSIVIRCGNDLKGLIRCVKSIDESVEIIASVSDQANFIKNLNKMGIKVAIHSYGNWSNAAESGIKVSNYNNLIIMDSDSVFEKGAIRLIYDALSAGHLVVQPQIEFLTDSTWISKIIRNSRNFENRYEPKAYSPGLGLKKRELIKEIGVNGCIYNTNVKYADDGNINKRVKENNINIFVEPRAIILHDPISLKHEIITAYRLGRGNRQGQIKKRGFFYPIIKGFLKKGSINYLSNIYKQYGLGTTFFSVVWRLIYIYGYYSEGFTRLKS